MPYWNKKNRIKNLVGLVLFPAVLFMLFRWFENKQVYQPFGRVEVNGDALGREWEDLWLETEDSVRINAWFFPTRENSERSDLVFLFNHGNAGNLSHRLETFQVLLSLGINLLSYDYRGYGNSEGSPSEEGTYLDATAAYDWLTERGFAPENIIAHGNSLGGGVASWLALNKPVGGLILQNTFTSVPDQGAEMFPWLPVRTLASIKYDTINRLPEIHVPVLLIHGEPDSIIPFSHAEKNFTASNEPKLLWKLSTDHNDSLINDQVNYLNGIKEFLEFLEARK